MNIGIQFFGGRGAGSGGPSLGMGGGENVNVIDTEDMMSYRKGSDAAMEFGGEAMSGVQRIYDDFPDIGVEQIQAAKLGGKDNVNVLGFYDGSNVAINQNYTDTGKMNAAYDKAVQSGFHPPRGDKSGTEAVAIHEMGHALTDHVGQKMGVNGIDESAKKIVDTAYKNTNSSGGTKAFAGKISGYAQQSYAECVAEAVADFYCNGSKASKESKAIVDVMRQYR